MVRYIVHDGESFLIIPVREVSRLYILLIKAVEHHLKEEYLTKYGNPDIFERDREYRYTTSRLDPTFQQQDFLYQIIRDIPITFYSDGIIDVATFRANMARAKLYIPGLIGVYRFVTIDEGQGYSTGACLDIAIAIARFYQDIKIVGATPQQMYYFTTWLNMCHEAIHTESFIELDFKMAYP